jgi:hypothetical protein
MERLKIIIIAIAGIFAASCASGIKTRQGLDAASHNPPNLEGYWGVEAIYVSMPEGIPQWVKDMYKTAKMGGYCPGQFSEDEKHDLAYKVTFKNRKKTAVIEKFYHKTQPFAFTVKEPGKETYTILADKKKGVYSTRISGEFKYDKFDTNHWKMKHPEPDDYNPNTGDPFPEKDSEWWKACEWHKRTE